ncbi:glycoside hydrolase family 13 protein [Dothidotthia symphoricarpi CBS 119687]|uniref:Glycoside hydrolase family 13 protein n=1 Tax=Dothidotthia symphoricarpi CBS 119687 TaxID=1392245 RepID=A0A6A5ZUX4_9PLEO|nr:glycoside hydrolase family 13 protein [Dothidotthia symphoricarpi CBS 119687]KAF2123450.1 glycoside hydrolase family 13 protein [Dothidotthia symphoricarpi CBS 119687]
MGSEEQTPTPENTTLFQGFEWNVPADNKHWKRLIAQVPKLKAIGIDNIWLPPGCKAASPEGNGYDIYDLYDLGEFDQKGQRTTKWGPKEDLLELAKIAKENGIGLYWDAVLNHKAGADNTEKCRVVEVDADDRTKTASDPYEIEGWLGFDFPGRGEKYSAQKYHWQHFGGTDYNQANERKAIYKILGDNKGWSGSVADEQGNADYMMFADIDYSHPEVQEDVKKWGVWITKEIGLKGFRLDAVQHFSEHFTHNWVDNLRDQCGKDIFCVGEYWSGDVSVMNKWLEAMERKFSLFDSPLLNNFSSLSKTESADLRKVFDKTLVQSNPVNAVTVVTNHDTQPGQTVETPIEGFFKPLAYALILLRKEGYPCPFYGDLYGLLEPHETPPSCGGQLADLILARKLFAYGTQEDYWDNANCIGFVRRGTWDKKAGLACVMSNTGPGQIRMAVGDMHAGEKWTDVLGWEQGEVEIDAEGYGMFNCPGTSVSVWVRSDAEGRNQFPTKFDVDIYKN